MPIMGRSSWIAWSVIVSARRWGSAVRSRCWWRDDPAARRAFPAPRSPAEQWSGLLVTARSHASARPPPCPEDGLSVGQRAWLTRPGHRRRAACATWRYASCTSLHGGAGHRAQCFPGARTRRGYMRCSGRRTGVAAPELAPPALALTPDPSGLLSCVRMLHLARSGSPFPSAAVSHVMLTQRGAIDRSVPRKTRRSKPDSTPEIRSWWLALKVQHGGSALSVEDVSLANAPHPTRAETPQLWLRLRRAVSRSQWSIQLPRLRPTVPWRVRAMSRPAASVDRRTNLPARRKWGRTLQRRPPTERCCHGRPTGA